MNEQGKNPAQDLGSIPRQNSDLRSERITKPHKKAIAGFFRPTPNDSHEMFRPQRFALLNRSCNTGYQENAMVSRSLGRGEPLELAH